MSAQARSDRSLRLVLSGASADFTLVISDAAEKPVATMVVSPEQLRDIIQSFGKILQMVESEVAGDMLLTNAPWQKVGVVVDAPSWRVTQEPTTGLVVLSLRIAPDAWWRFTLVPIEARQLGERLGQSVGGEPATDIQAPSAIADRPILTQPTESVA